MSEDKALPPEAIYAQELFGQRQWPYGGAYRIYLPPDYTTYVQHDERTDPPPIREAVREPAIWPELDYWLKQPGGIELLLDVHRAFFGAAPTRTPALLALTFQRLEDGRVIAVDPPGFPDEIEVDAQGMARGEAEGVLRLEVSPAGSTKLYVDAANGRAEYVLLDLNASTFTRRFGRLYRRGPDRVDG